MAIKISAYIFGLFLKYFGILMLVPILCTIIYGEDDHSSFLISAFVTIVAGYGLELLNKPAEDIKEINRKSGFLIVTLCWLGAGLFGSLPYILQGVLSNPADALFESVSGFTTTGASVISDPGALTHGILFWRNFTQWLGGMGIVLLAIAVLPRLSVGGMQLMGYEAPGPTTEKLTPRISETAKKLWFIYILLTALLLIFLLLAGMPFFDSLLHSFSTLATGGFSTQGLSIGAYNNVYIEIIITIFMFLAGVNFVLHYSLYRRDFKKVASNSELKFYIALNLGFIAVISAIFIYSGYYESLTDALRYSSFQVLSISTTTGFATDDFNLWPPIIQFLLFSLMFIGASAGSTAGSIKTIRILVLVKKGYRELKQLLYPRGVFPIRIDNRTVNEKIVSSISAFFVLYIFIAVTSAIILLVIEDISVLTALSACAATLGVIGPGLDQVGPMENYMFFKDSTKLFLAFLMIVGRLELYAVLVILTPAFWRK